MRILLPRLSILAVALLFVVAQNWLEACWKEPCLNHTVFPQEESSLALLSKFSISWGTLNVFEGFALDPYLMT